MLAFPSLCTPVSSYREMAIKENLDDLSDLALEEREAREEMNYLKSHLDFDEDKQKDDDLYFVQGDDYEIKNRKSVDYSDWKKKRNKYPLNDKTEEEEAKKEKGFLKKMIEKIKNMLHKFGKRS